MVATGLLAIGAYVRELIELWNASDRSMLYWTLFLPLTGIPFVGVGISVIETGRRARHDPAVRALAGKFLAGLGILSTVLAVAIHFRQQRMDQMSRVFDQHLQLDADRIHNARKLQRIDVAIDGNESMTIRTQPSDGLDGRYRWALEIREGDAVLWKTSRDLSLKGIASPIVQNAPYTEVFAKCFDSVPSAAYACARNSQASDSYTVQASLELLEDAHGAIAPVQTRDNPLLSTASKELRLTTRTDDRAVLVIGVQQDPGLMR